MAPLWAFVLVLFFRPAECQGPRYQEREEGGVAVPGADIHYNMRNSMYGYIIHKGCDYVKYFVWSHYMKHSHDMHGHQRFIREPICNWQDAVKGMFAAGHVPEQIANALVDCGPYYSFYAAGIKDWHVLYGHCNMSADHGHDLHAVVIAGKRATSVDRSLQESKDYSDLPIDLPSISAAHMGVDVSPQLHLSNQDRPAGNVLLSSSQDMHRANLMKWCRHYTRSVNRRFHLDKKKFVRTSPHWLVDVYKMAERFATPTSYIHGLVGCGQKYALDAFGVPAWISVSYSRD